jgi:hypothetical protein
MECYSFVLSFVIIYYKRTCSVTILKFLVFSLIRYFCYVVLTNPYVYLRFTLFSLYGHTAGLSCMNSYRPPVAHISCTLLYKKMNVP